VTNKTAGTRYARALLDVGVQQKADLEHVGEELASFVELFTTNPELGRVLLNPAVPVARKRAAVAELAAAGRLSSIVSKLVVLLAERDRLTLLPDLLASYRERLLDYQNVVRAEVTTAAALPDDRARALERSLAAKTGRTVRLATRVDPSIIGGVVARIGSTVYDGSVTRQLEKLKETLVQPSRSH
jgi:F-type H+-transporting ATPase subunit delta